MENQENIIGNDRFPIRYFLYFVLIAIVIVITGYLFYLQREKLIEDEFSRHIVAIKEIKLQQIESEQNQRKKIIESFLSIPSVKQEFSRLFLSRSKAASLQRISVLTDDLILNLGFSSVNIFDTKTNLLYTTDSLYNIKQNFLKHELTGLLAKDFSAFSNMYISSNKNLIQAVIVPVKSGDDVLGFVWAEYSFFEYLYPIIGYTKQEPGDIEFVLLKTDGDLAFVLREVPESDTISILAIPISKDDREALKSILNNPDVVKDIMFRGHRIYASVKKIFGSDWNLIAKINEEQIIKSVRNTAIFILTIAVLLIILSAAITYANWKRSRLHFLSRTFRLRKEKEALSERYTSLTKYANDMIMSVDKDGKILEANQKTIDIYGYSKEELLNMNILDLSSDRVKDSKIIFTSVNADEGILFETIHKRKDGSVVPVEISSKIIRQGEEEVLLSIIRDNTERKKLQSDLIFAKEKAEQNDRLKTIILTNMSHELNTPMSGIIGFSEILMLELEDKNHNEMASLIHKSSTRLNDTLTSILDLSKLESEKVSLNFETINLVPVIINSVESYINIAQDKNVEIVTDFSEEKILVKADVNILTKIIKNLLNNAVKYTEKGMIRISAKYDADKTIIKVEDSGIGIPKTDIEKIFEPFRQVSEGSTRVYEGTGIGLTITKKFVELLGGNILIDSSNNEGTKVTIVLPRAF